jgi:hypothetical protein
MEGVGRDRCCGRWPQLDCSLFALHSLAEGMAFGKVFIQPVLADSLLVDAYLSLLPPRERSEYSEQAEHSLLRQRRTDTGNQVRYLLVRHLPARWGFVRGRCRPAHR